MPGESCTTEILIPEPLLSRLQDAQTVSVLTGAGISAESGVPTFRGAGGIWEKYDFRKLATPEGFWSNPILGWEWYQLRQVEMKRSSPNPAHRAIAEMEPHYQSFVVLTQNIDGIHRRAGNRNIVELHGSIWRMRCPRDGRTTELDAPVSEIPPLCECGSILRPDVVWFGETLRAEALEAASMAAERSEVMFVVGTSAVVYPAAALPIITKKSGGVVVEVNVELTDVSRYAEISLFGRAGMVMPALWKIIATPKAL